MFNCYASPPPTPGRSRASPLRPRQGFRDVSTGEEEERRYTAGVKGRSGEMDAQTKKRPSHFFKQEVSEKLCILEKGLQKKYLFHLLKPKHFQSESEWSLSVLIVSQYNDSAVIDILRARHL